MVGRPQVQLGQDATGLRRSRLAEGEMPGLREVVALLRSDGRITVGQVVGVGSGQVVPASAPAPEPAPLRFISRILLRRALGA